MSVIKLERVIKLSELNAKTENEINRIKHKNVNLVPCDIDINEEDIKFVYSIENLKSSDQIKTVRDVEKLRFLINVYNLFNMYDEYTFSIEPENLYYDYNFNVKIKDRDIKLKEDIVDIENLIMQYKSLIGYVFDKKYTYENFYNGGIDLLKKNKKTSKYLEIINLEEIRNQLLSDLKDKEKEDKDKYVEIKKRDFNIKKYSIYAMSAVITGLVGYTVYTSAFLIPFQRNVIKADNYYSEKNYEGVIKSLEKTRGMKLSKESKYKLAYSYITSESLSEDQKKNIILMLNEKSDENILDYWIAIGKSDFDEAIDLAKKVQDNELLLYSLLSKEKAIQDNTKMTGEEKEKVQTELETQIEKINKELNGDGSSNKIQQQPVENDAAKTSETESQQSEAPLGLDLNPGN